ncbi:hypothetical protein CC80DRAFT_170370 [Byssothecium circinans]|uniref:Uncharacterized protein n=1 Tax=Byssothecium circinans TaxID=147558 RepID=A0A6A5TIY5_9PLEO|nr:hypothetical protein CC80DRAFT_170370 [Byssothecium circinans]
MVTHSTTSPPVSCLYMAERTGSLVLKILWSYVKVRVKLYIHIATASHSTRKPEQGKDRKNATIRGVNAIAIGIILVRRVPEVIKPAAQVHSGCQSGSNVGSGSGSSSFGPNPIRDSIHCPQPGSEGSLFSSLSGSGTLYPGPHPCANSFLVRTLLSSMFPLVER